MGLVDARNAVFLTASGLALAAVAVSLWRRPPAPWRWSEPAGWTAPLVVLVAVLVLAFVLLVRSLG
jgi:hypothetical protein